MLADKCVQLATTCIHIGCWEINHATLYADASHEHFQCKITNLELLDMTLDVLNVFVSATSVQNNVDVFTIYLTQLQKHDMIRWCTGMPRHDFL